MMTIPMSRHLKVRGQNRKLRKRIIITAVTLAVLTAAVLGTWFFIQYRNSQKTVEVMPVSYLSTTYWGDETSSSGTILSDYMQELYPTADRIISEVFVSEGQEVHIGDPLLQYDKTRLELDVEAKDLAVKQEELKIEDAQNQLRKLQNTTPVSTSNPVVTPRPTLRPTNRPGPTPTPTPTPSQGPTPIPPADVTLYSRLDYDSAPYSGSGTSDDPYVYLCTDGCIMTKEFLCQLLGIDQPDNSTDGPDEGSEDGENDEGDGDGESSDDSPSEELPGDHLASPFAAVFEVREGNSNYGNVISSFRLDGTRFSASIKTMTELETSTMEDIRNILLDATPTPTPTPNADNYNDMGYTSSQLKELIAEKQTEIRDLQFNLKQAKLNLEVAQRALKNSTVLSNVDGKVRTLIDLEVALAEGKPFMVVSGDDRFYISGALNEGLLGSVNVGDTINAMSWMNGMTYSAQIVSISEFPMESSNYYYGGANNPNSSNYEFTAVIDSDDDTLENGMYVEITMNVQAEDDGQALYLEKPYLREDDAGFYVMKAGRDNRLHKQYVETGKSIYGGGYLEIRSGLTVDDFIAFPYGVDTKEGVRVVLQGSGEPPYPEEGVAGTNSLPEGKDSPASSEDGTDNADDESGAGENGTDDSGAFIADVPDGAVITGHDENGIYFKTEDGGGVILD